MINLNNEGEIITYETIEGKDVTQFINEHQTKKFEIKDRKEADEYAHGKGSYVYVLMVKTNGNREQYGFGVPN